MFVVVGTQKAKGNKESLGHWVQMWHYSKKSYPKYARVAYLCIETTHSASWHQNAMQECWPS